MGNSTLPFLRKKLFFEAVFSAAFLLADFELPYAGALLFMSDPSQHLANYDVYHTMSNASLGPFSQSYVLLGKVHEVYAVLPGLSPQNRVASAREVLLGARLRQIRTLCGYGKPIHQMWAFSNPHGSLDLYVQTMGQRPPDVFSHYMLQVAEPADWWRARSYDFIDVVSMPDWAPKVPRSAL